MRPRLLDFDGALGSGVAGFTSSRQGGISTGPFDSLNLGTHTGDVAEAVAVNRRRAYAELGLDAERGVYLEQVHGDRIHEALAGDAGKGFRAFDQGIRGTDAVFTRQKDLPLAIGHADCLAVVLVDSEAGLLGLAHAGWRGALAGLPGKLAQRLVDEGAKPGRLKALLSPCISPDGLELSEDQHAAFSALSDHGEFCSPLRQGKFHLDLRGAARAQLRAVGLSEAQIAVQAPYSDAQAELFYSYRRDNGKTGRMLTVAALL